MTEQQHPPVEGLPDPGNPLVLTVKVEQSGQGHTQYTVAPEDAVRILRSIADQIESETYAADGAFPDGCNGEHSPASNPACTMRPATDDLYDAYMEPTA